MQKMVIDRGRATAGGRPGVVRKTPRGGTAWGRRGTTGGAGRGLPWGRLKRSRREKRSSHPRSLEISDEPVAAGAIPLRVGVESSGASILPVGLPQTVRRGRFGQLLV